MSETAPIAAERLPRRVNGLVLMVALVAAGMGITSIYYHWKAPAIVAERRAALASMSTDPEPMLALWLEYGAPAIHARLTQMRIGSQHPWLVTHAQEAQVSDEPPRLWGIDFAELGPDWVRREGLAVVVELPAPRELGRAWLPADKEGGVVRLAPGVEAPPAGAAAARAREVALWSLERLDRAVRKDIPGASLAVHVGGEGP
ncbi:MAG TPA: hypothetical protein VMT18_04460 [Planctomycetota bacterium]|nr:hypothetical protein [Planctomycetota bacterium]